MDIDSQKKFRTTTGFCHILPDKIAFTKDGRQESIDLSPPKDHRSVKFALVYGLIIFLIIGFIVYKYLGQEIDLATTIITISLIVVFLYYIYKVINYQARTYFDRDKIVKVKYISALSSLTHGQFIFSIKSDNGKILNANIILRPKNIYGKQETEDAIKIMVDEGLISDPNIKNVG
jgi:hypothetical protein